MGAWIISISALALLTVLVDVVLPAGNTQKYVKAVVGVVLSFVIISSLSNLVGQISSSNERLQDSLVVQQQFISGLDSQRQLARLQTVQRVAENLSVKNASVSMLDNGYVCLKVQCSMQVLQQLQMALPKVESKIMILWSDSNG